MFRIIPAVLRSIILAAASRAQKNTCQIDIDNALPILQGHLLDDLARFRLNQQSIASNPGIIDQTVQRFKIINHSLKQFNYRRLVGDIRKISFRFRTRRFTPLYCFVDNVSLRPTIAKFAPLAANASAMARPRPRPLPVITMVLPFTFIMDPPNTDTLQTPYPVTLHPGHAQFHAID